MFMLALEKKCEMPVVRVDLNWSRPLRLKKVFAAERRILLGPVL